MPDYRRARHPGGIYFFTLTLLRRHNNDLLTRHIEELREAVRRARRAHPFNIHGWVVLPEGDTDFTLRLRLIKASFSKSLPRTEWLSAVRRRRGERGVWQRRFWEHLIKDEADYRAHMDYVHINPVKHGLVKRVADWPYSIFHRLVAQGVYPLEWAGSDGAEALGYPD